MRGNWGKRVKYIHCCQETDKKMETQEGRGGELSGGCRCFFPQAFQIFFINTELLFLVGNVCLLDYYFTSSSLFRVPLVGTPAHKVHITVLERRGTELNIHDLQNKRENNLKRRGNALQTVAFANACMCTFPLGLFMHACPFKALGVVLVVPRLDEYEAFSVWAFRVGCWKYSNTGSV